MSERRARPTPPSTPEPSGQREEGVQLQPDDQQDDHCDPDRIAAISSWVLPASLRVRRRRGPARPRSSCASGARCRGKHERMATPPVVVMGVSGSGKSVVGAALAQRLRVPFGDADDLHPAANIAKMTPARPSTTRTASPGSRRSAGGWRPGRRGWRHRLLGPQAEVPRPVRHHAPRVEFLHLDGSRDVIPAGRPAGRGTSCRPPCSRRSSRRSSVWRPTRRVSSSTSTSPSTQSSRSTCAGRRPMTGDQGMITVSAGLAGPGRRDRSRRSSSGTSASMGTCNRAGRREVRDRRQRLTSRVAEEVHPTQLAGGQRRPGRARRSC